MPSRTLALLTTLVLAAGIAGSAPAASAGSAAEPVSELHLADPVGDAYTNDGSPGTGINVDIARTNIWRRAERLVLRFHFVNLVPPHNLEWGMSFGMHHRDGARLLAEWSEAQGTAGGSRGGKIVRIGEDEETTIDCPGLHARRNYDNDMFTFWLPADCFGDRERIVLTGLHTWVNRNGPSGQDRADSSFGDQTDPYAGRTPRLVDPD